MKVTSAGTPDRIVVAYGSVLNMAFLTTVAHLSEDELRLYKGELRERLEMIEAMQRLKSDCLAQGAQN